MIHHMASSHWHARGQLRQSKWGRPKSKNVPLDEPEPDADGATETKDATSKGSPEPMGQKTKMNRPPLTMHRALEGSAMLTLGKSFFSSHRLESHTFQECSFSR